MEQMASASLFHNKSELSTSSPLRPTEVKGGQINLNLIGLLTVIELVFTARTPFVGGLSLLRKYIITLNSVGNKCISLDKKNIKNFH